MFSRLAYYTMILLLSNNHYKIVLITSLVNVVPLYQNQLLIILQFVATCDLNDID